MSAAFCHSETTADLAASSPVSARAAHRAPHRDSPAREGSLRAATAGALDVSRPEHALLLALGFAAVVPLQHLARAADANAFTSWRWVSSGPAVARCVALLVPATLAAVAAARLVRGRARRLLLVALPVAAAVPLWSEPEAILDAARYFVQARWLEEVGAGRFLREWGRGIDAWTDLPLVPFLYGVAFSTVGESRRLVQALDTTLFAATALLLWRIGRALWDEEAGLHAGLLLVAIPYLLVQVPLLLVDVPTAFFVALALHALLAAARRGGALRTGACALALSAAALAKYSTWPVLAVLAAAAPLAARGERRTAAARVLAAAGASALLVGALALSRADVFRRQMDLLWGWQRPALGRWDEGLASTFLFQTHPLVTALAAAGAVRALRRRDARFLAVACPVALALVPGAARTRYLLPLLPLVALMASYGLCALADRRTRTAVALCAVAASAVVARTAYLPFLRGTSMANLAAAGEYLDALPGSIAVVEALPQGESSGSTFAAIPILDYQTRKRLVSPQEWPRGDRAARTSPLRFTWEMRKPAFYEPARATATSTSTPTSTPTATSTPTSTATSTATSTPTAIAPPHVLISDGTRPIPAAPRQRTFAATSAAFRYQTVVTVQQPD